MSGCAILQATVQYSKNAPVELIRKLEECLTENCPAGYAQPQLELVPLVHLQQQGRNTMNVAKSMYVHTTPFVTEAAILPPLRRRRLLVPTAQTMEVEVQQDQDLAPCVSLSVHQRKGRHQPKIL